MNKIEMQLQQINKQSKQEWFENSCNWWVDHYSFLLGLSYYTEADKVWFREKINMNKIYDV